MKNCTSLGKSFVIRVEVELRCSDAVDNRVEHGKFSVASRLSWELDAQCALIDAGKTLTRVGV